MSAARRQVPKMPIPFLPVEMRINVAGHITGKATGTKREHNYLLKLFIILCAGDHLGVKYNMRRIRALRFTLHGNIVDYASAYDRIAMITPHADAQIAAVWPFDTTSAAIRHYYLIARMVRVIWNVAMYEMVVRDVVRGCVLWINVPLDNDTFYLRICVHQMGVVIAKLLPHDLGGYLLVPTWVASQRRNFVLDNVDWDDFLEDLAHERLQLNGGVLKLGVNHVITKRVVTQLEDQSETEKQLQADTEAV